MNETPLRVRLAEAIRGGMGAGCGGCRSGARTCPECAADAVLDACRRQELWIMPQADADALLLAEGRRARAEAYDELAVEVERWKGYGQTMALDSLVEHVRELAANARKSEGAGA